MYLQVVLKFCVLKIQFLGEKVFADNTSLIGGIGALHRHYNVAKFLKGYDIYFEKYNTSKYFF